MKRLRVLLAVTLAAAIGGAAFYLSSGRPERLRLTGIVDGNEVVVAAKITGRIQAMNVRTGDRVQAGQVIAVLDHEDLSAASDATKAAASQAEQLALQARDQLALLKASTAARVVQARAQVREAEAQVAQAQAPLGKEKATYARTEDLFHEDFVTAQDLDNAKAALDSARAGVEVADRALAVARAGLADAEAQEQQVSVQQRQVAAYEAAAQQARAAHRESEAMLAQARVTAPISGVVTLRAAREGEVVTPADPVVTIFQLDDTWVDADVEETYADLVRLGEVVTVELPSGATTRGTVFYKGVEAGFATQRDVSRTKRDIKTVELRVRVANPGGRLARGMTAWVELPLATGKTS